MFVLVRGGGDLASGAALRLHRSGVRVLIAELAQPLVVRRLVSFAEAVFTGETYVEDVRGTLIKTPDEAFSLFSRNEIPILVDPDGSAAQGLSPLVVVDARMTKQAPESGMEAAPLVIGLGPGFWAGKNCHAVIETNRGHFLGRVLWEGRSETDTGIPEAVMNKRSERVLRSPADGTVTNYCEICDHVDAGQVIAEVHGTVVRAPFAGVLRGLVHPGIAVKKGEKIGDVDPRDDPHYCRLVSDKSLAVGGGVLEAVLSRPEIRSKLLM